MCVCELISISFPQLVQRYVPDETSLPAGTGFATVGSLLRVKVLRTAFLQVGNEDRRARLVAGSCVCYDGGEPGLSR
jgi:hypothetical protein